MLRLQVTTGSSLPIYRQVIDQIRHAVASEKIKVGEPLPSVRALAGELLVNPNTIAKAYSALVRDGVLESQQGRGYFVAERREIYTRKERQRRLEEVLDPFLAEAITLGFDEQQIVDEIRKRLARMSRSKS
ncbi:MAG: GntR family transcriptional regulator [Rubripirellula sp.]